MKRIWTNDERALIGTLLGENMTAKQIGERVDATRCAIIGLVYRDKDLASIGFARGGKSREGGRIPRFTPEQRLERSRQYNKAYAARRRGDNVIPFPTPTRKTPEPVARAAPALRVVSNNVSLMVDDWLKRNGGARKFNQRESTDEYGVIGFLSERGIAISKSRHNWNNRHGAWKVSKGQGRPRVLSWPEVMEMVDDLRMKEGLQPFQQRARIAVAKLS